MKKYPILSRIIILLFSLWLISIAYTCLESNGQEKCEIPQIFFVGTLILTLFLLAFLIKEKRLDVLWKYLVEFIILIFGIYEVIIIKSIIEGDFFTEKFRIIVALLIFIALICLLDIRKRLEK